DLEGHETAGQVVLLGEEDPAERAAPQLRKEAETQEIAANFGQFAGSWRRGGPVAGSVYVPGQLAVIDTDPGRGVQGIEHCPVRGGVAGAPGTEHAGIPLPGIPLAGTRHGRIL